MSASSPSESSGGGGVSSTPFDVSFDPLSLALIILPSPISELGWPLLPSFLLITSFNGCSFSSVNTLLPGFSSKLFKFPRLSILSLFKSSSIWSTLISWARFLFLLSKISSPLSSFKGLSSSRPKRFLFLLSALSSLSSLSSSKNIKIQCYLKSLVSFLLLIDHQLH